MYVRAPKHFKSGKQHLFFFRGCYYNTYRLNSNNHFYDITKTTGAEVFSGISYIVNDISLGDCELNKIILKQDAIIKLFVVGVIFVQLVLNAIVFSFIFWILTFLAKSLFSSKYYDYKLNFYECGFKNLTKKNISYEINYVMIVLFLLIYDGEFLILVPFVLNITKISVEVVICILVFVAWIIAALLFDYCFGALEWQVSVRFYTSLYLFKN